MCAVLYKYMGHLSDKILFFVCYAAFEGYVDDTEKTGRT